MDKKKLKILLIITPIVTVLAIVLCIVIAKMDSKSEDESKSESQNESKNEGIELDTDSVNSFAICKDPDCVFLSNGSLCVCKNGVLMMYDPSGDCKEFDTGLDIVKGESGDKLYFIDGKGGLYGFDTESQKTELVMNGVSDVSLGGFVNGVLTTDGRLFMWGEKAGVFVGQIGDVTKPAEYKSDVHWTKIAFGTYELLALDDNGNVYEAYLRDEKQTQLKKIEQLKDISQICSRAETVAVSKDGTIHYWIGAFGSDNGDPMIDDPDKIEKVLNELKPTHFSLYYGQSIAYDDKSAYFWGESGLSRTTKSADNVRSPELCRSLTDFDSIYCGGNVIFKKNGTKVTAYRLHM